MASRQPAIFISYGRKDAEPVARRLAEWLRAQGYEAWLDLERGIPPGSPFDDRIEAGIEASELLIALLSRWATRPKSFCRREYLFAEEIDRPIIPVKLEDVHPLPIQIIHLSFLGFTDPPEAVFDQLTEVLPRVLDGHGMPDREWAPTAPTADMWWERVSRLSFAEELARRGEGFAGRDWLFDDLRDWVNQDDLGARRVLLLTGDAGVGKSAIAAQMTARLDVKGIHFCSRSQSGSCHPVAWLKTLVAQLATQFEPYRRQIEALREPTWQETPVELFRSLVSDPLLECQDQLETTEPWVFVLDGLDEALAEAGSAFVNLLAASTQRLPQWLRLIVTSRPSSEVLESLDRPEVQHWPLSVRDEHNLADLEAFVRRRVGRLVARGVAGAQDAAVPQSVIDVADGNFLVARMLLAGLADPQFRLDVRRVRDHPNRLYGTLHELFRLRFGDPHDQQDARQREAYERYRSRVRPLLDCLVVARAPVPADLLIAASGLDVETAREGLRLLSQFLSEEQGGLRVFHQSVVEWLTLDQGRGPGIYAAVRQEGQQRLAEACWHQFEEGIEGMSGYARDHLAVHLAESGRWSQLASAIVSDLGLLQRWIERGEGDQGIFCLTRLLGSGFLDGVSAAALASQLARIYGLRGEYDQGEQWLQYALARTTAREGRRVRAVALHEIGSLHLYRCQHAEANRRYREALKLCELRPRLVDEMAANRIALATVAAAEYHWSTVLRLAERAGREAESVGDYRHVAAADRLVGNTLEDLGRYEEALARLSETLEQARGRQATLEEVRLLGALGWFHYGRAHAALQSPQEAARWFSEAHDAARPAHNLHGVLDAKLGLGWCRLADGATEEARARFADVLDRLPQDIHQDLQCAAQVGMAAADHQQGEHATAEPKYAAAIKRAEALEFRNWAARGLCGQGGILWHSGRQQEAEGLWKRAREHARRVSPRLRELTEANVVLCREGPSSPPR